MNTPPHLDPAQICDTRIQHELVSSPLHIAVPVELELHAAMLVGPDLLSRLADHDRGLRGREPQVGA